MAPRFAVRCLGQRAFEQALPLGFGNSRQRVHGGVCDAIGEVRPSYLRVQEPFQPCRMLILCKLIAHARDIALDLFSPRRVTEYDLSTESCGVGLCAGGFKE